MRILLVEDNESIGESLREGLVGRRYVVDWVKNGIAAWTAIQQEHFDLVILDINLPKLSGEEVLKNIRNKNITTPIIILTSADSTEFLVKHFDIGADDYITKPFNLESLCARIRAIRRRFNHMPMDLLLKSGDVSLDPATRMVFKNEKMVELSRREFTLLQILLENAGKVVRREQATQSMYGWGYDIDSNALEVHVHNLRKKLELNNLATIRGIGYMLKKPIAD
jgi:two-component system response regulator QseB